MGGGLLGQVHICVGGSAEDFVKRPKKILKILGHFEGHHDRNLFVNSVPSAKQIVHVIGVFPSDKVPVYH